MTMQPQPDGPKIGDPRRLENGTWWYGYKHARDIPDQLFLTAMAIAAKERAQAMKWHRVLPANRWDIAAVLATGHINESIDDNTLGVPHKVVLAKAKRLIKRGIITGCDCGCRGDFELPGRNQ